MVTLARSFSLAHALAFALALALSLAPSLSHILSLSPSHFFLSHSRVPFLWLAFALSRFLALAPWLSLTFARHLGRSCTLRDPHVNQSRHT